MQFITDQKGVVHKVVDGKFLGVLAALAKGETVDLKEFGGKPILESGFEISGSADIAQAAARNMLNDIAGGSGVGETVSLQRKAVKLVWAVEDSEARKPIESLD